jgi:hypothetical protein
VNARSRPAAVPYRPQPPDGEELVQWLALRLYRRHRAEPVRTLEALAAVEAARLAARPPAGTPARAPLPAGDPAAGLCRRIARRALAGSRPPGLASAVRWHRAATEPAWARGRLPCAEIGGFLFYAASEP